MAALPRTGSSRRRCPAKRVAFAADPVRIVRHVASLPTLVWHPLLIRSWWTSHACFLVCARRCTFLQCCCSLHQAHAARSVAHQTTRSTNTSAPVRLRWRADVRGWRHGRRGPWRARRLVGRASQRGAPAGRLLLCVRCVAASRLSASRAAGAQAGGRGRLQARRLFEAGCGGAPAARGQASPQQKWRAHAGGDKPAALLGDGSDQVRRPDAPRPAARAGRPA